LQVLVPGNTWKGCYLLDGEYCLTSEAVSPGFAYEDMTLGV
jgi:predicted cupin superfamily sugar epimerase